MPRTATRRRLQSITSAADYLNVSTRTVRRLISSGRLTGYRVGNRIIRIDPAELDAMLREIPTAGGPHEAA
jgi:excisionase family DNA binding protein